MQKGDMVLYRGNKCKVKSVEKKKTTDSYEYEMVELNHPKYKLLVNAEFVIKC